MRRGTWKTNTWMATQSGKGSAKSEGGGRGGEREGGEHLIQVVRLAKIECIYIFLFI